MSETPFAVHVRDEGPTFRYGMLLLISVLWCSAWWNWLTRTPQDGSGPLANVVVSSMLLVNHVISSFLSVEHRRRVRPIQVIFIGACLLFVVRRAFSH